MAVPHRDRHFFPLERLQLAFGVPRTITGAQVEEVVVRTLEVPPGATHWSKRELAARVGISPTSVHRIWRAFGLQPRRQARTLAVRVLAIGRV